MNQTATAASTAKWEHFPHDADVGVRGFGATAAEAFEQAAQALTAVVTQTAVKPKIRVEVTCEAPDLESTANFFVTNWIAIKFQAPHGRRSEMFEFIGYRAFGFCSALPSVCTENFIRID